MADEIMDSEAALDRLDAALERIARHRGAQTDGSVQRDPRDPVPAAGALAARLDALIGRIRTVLGPPRA